MLSGLHFDFNMGKLSGSPRTPGSLNVREHIATASMGAVLFVGLVGGGGGLVGERGGEWEGGWRRGPLFLTT